MEFTLKEIVSKLPVTEVVGDSAGLIRQVVSASGTVFSSDCILWISDKNADLLKNISAGYVICSVNIPRSEFKSSCTYLIVTHPRQYFAQLIRTFFDEKEEAFVSDRAVIDATVKLGKEVTIGPGVVLEKNCVVGDHSSIGANTVIKKGTHIGAFVKIGSNNTIGGVGFGYEKNETGGYELIPHIGNVVIEDQVEIGNNTCIDRAVLGSTFIRKNAKIDNLVHIAHGVEIGENSLIIANAMIAGSSSIGKNVWVAPSASVLNKVSVDDNAVIGMGAVVLKNVAAGQTIIGNPGRELLTGKKD